MRVSITHTTRLDYSAEVVEGVTEAHLGPLSDAHQRWTQYSLRAAPNGRVGRYTDPFGNAAHLVTLSRAHQFMEIVTRSEVETLLTDPFVPLAAPAEPLTPAESWDFLQPTALVPRHEGLETLAAPYRADRTPDQAFEIARELTTLVHDSFVYEPHVTTVTTTVAEVLQDRRGVCQDFAHVLIGLCRALAIPARYVSGYIVASTGLEQAGLRGADGPARGAGASHAWIEAYSPTHGWRGFDPTNDLLASDSHVKMAIGRDYSDVAPTRGAYRGAAEEQLSVQVVARIKP